MTSEVVVMNSLAVALAADSAATVTDGRDKKTYNSANKLFMLSKCHPVGVMVYNNSSLLGIPWETILKMFREELGDKDYDRLEEYGDDLIKYLDKNDYLFPDDVQEKFYLSLVEQLYRGMFKEVQKRVVHFYLEAEEEPDGTKIAKEVILRALKEWSDKKDVECFVGDNVGTSLAGKFSGEIHLLAAKVFDGLKLDTEATTALRDLAIHLVNKDDFLTESLSGVVIAGFGRKDYFPVMQPFELGEVFLGRLKFRKTKVDRVGGINPSVVRSFAQSEMVDTFLGGVNPTFELRMIEEFVNLMVRYPNEIIDAITDLSPEQKSSWKEKIRGQSAEPIRSFVKELEKHRIEKHREPILQAVINLPIEELAHVAASLVNLNLFQKKVSLGPETVGGPVDVAVISKGDGFIWIDRKHYFKPDFNHHFFRNYGERLARHGRNQTEGDGHGE